MKRKTAHWPFAPDRFPIFYGWPLLAAGTLGILMSVPGQTMGVSVFTDSLLGALKITRDQLSFAYMVGTLASAAFLPYAGRLYDRHGARLSAAVACLCLSAVLVLLSQSDIVAGQIAAVSGVGATVAAFVVVLPAFMALRFFGQGVMTLSSHNMIAKWFDRRRGFAVGVSGVFTALGFSTAPIVLDLAIGAFGWRGAWIAMAAVITLGFLPIVFALYRDNPEACGLYPDGHTPTKEEEDTAREARPDWTLQQARRTGLFWVFSLSFSLIALYGTGLTFHIVNIFESAGMTRTDAVSIFLPASAVAVMVHLSGGWLSDRIPLNRLLALMLAGLMLAMVGLTQLAPGWPVACLIVGNGLSMGLFTLLSAVAWAKFFGRRQLGAISGLNMSVVVFHSALGPVIFSQSVSWTDSYRAAGIFCALAGMSLLTALFVVRCDKPRKPVLHAEVGHGIRSETTPASACTD